MEGTRSKQIHNENCMWGSHSFLKQTSPQLSNFNSEKPLQHQSYPRYDKNYKRIEGATSIRKTDSDQPEFLVKDVHNSEEQRRAPPDFRSPGIEQVCPHQAFPINISCLGARVSSGKGLDGEDRHFKCLFSRTNSGVTSLLPADGIWRGSVADVGPSFWPSIGSTDVCVTNELGRGDPSNKRNSCSSLSRRLPCGPTRPIQVGHTDCGSPRPLGVAGMVHKLSKVSTCTNKTTRVLGNYLEYRDKFNVPVRRKGKKDRRCYSNNGAQEKMQPKTSAKDTRPDELRQLRRTKRPSPLSVPTNIPEAIQTQPKDDSPTTSTGFERSQMVEPGTTVQGSSASTCSHTLPDNRCSGCRLGSSAKRTPDVRDLDRRTEEVALESKGTLCSLCLDSKSTTPSSGCPHSDTVRQSDSRVLYSERGRDTLLEFTQPHMQVVEADRQEQHPLISSLPPGEVQLHCRSPLKGTASIRMAPSAHCNKPNIPALGHPRRRPVRVEENCSGQQLCLDRLQGQDGSVFQCLQPELEMSTGVGLSSPQPHAPSASSFEQFKGPVHSNSTSVGEDILVGRLEVASHRTASTNRKALGESSGHGDRYAPTTGRPIEPSSLVSWRWGEVTRNWSDTEKQLLNTSWRQSTMSTYFPAIKRWLTWCDANKVDGHCPRMQEIARFMAYLHLKEKLAYSTILVHKSAILTFCKVKESEQSNHMLLKQVLKAIATSQPIKQKPPVWDPQIVFDWLSVPNNRNTLFEVSRRAAAILLLASGRRLHDLTLLKISENNFTISEEKAILWPAYGSKTDTAGHRQSGWLLLKHPNQQVCPVTWIGRLIAQSRERRREKPGLDELFITINGDARPASRTVIGGWIRSVLREAGITASPGSFRSAVASASWLENHPMDEILSRGNWKSENTFKKFYCKEIAKKAKGAQLLFKNFQPEK